MDLTTKRSLINLARAVWVEKRKQKSYCNGLKNEWEMSKGRNSENELLFLEYFKQSYSAVVYALPLCNGIYSPVRCPHPGFHCFPCYSFYLSFHTLFSLLFIQSFLRYNLSFHTIFPSILKYVVKVRLEL